MDWKLKTALIRRSSEQGFAMPVAVGLGLVMLLVAATMVVRSQSDQVTASAQQKTSQSLSVSEAGFTRVQSFLKKYPYLASVNATEANPWSTYLTSSAFTGGTACSAGTPTYLTDAQNLSGWQTVNGGPDRFKIISYTYNETDTLNKTGVGTLVVQGQALLGTNVTSTSQVQVTMPVDRNPPGFKPPGAWANYYNFGQNKFKVDTIIDTGCTSTIPTTATTGGNPTLSPATTGGTVNVIRDPTLKLPGPATVPPQCPAPASFTAANKPCAIYLSSPVTASTTFPITTDITNYPAGTGNLGEYIYYIPRGSGTDSISLSGNTGSSISIATDRKTTLYLEGNITMTGNATLDHNCSNAPSTQNPPCKSTDLQIYGGVNTTSIAVKGNATIDTFIFAPNAVGGVSGGGQVRGSVWISGWSASNANQLVLTQTGEWDDLPVFVRPLTIKASTSWERQQQ